MNAHRGIVNRLPWMQRAYGLRAADRVLQKTPFSFDVSVWELFWPLMFGARLVIARPEGHRDPRYLAGRHRGRRASPRSTSCPRCSAPSSTSRDVDRLRGSLRRVFAQRRGAAARAGRALLRAPRRGVELHNLYGPTEAAVDVTAWACRRGAAVVPIGRPIDNVADLRARRAPATRCPIGVARASSTSAACRSGAAT